MESLEIIVEDTEIDKYLTQFDDLLKSKDVNNVKMAIIMYQKHGFLDTIFNKSDLEYIKLNLIQKTKKSILNLGMVYYNKNIPNYLGNLINYIETRKHKIDRINAIKNRNLIRIHERNAKTL